jgi:hypothetical protein
MTRTDGEARKHPAAEVLIARIGDGHAGQRLGGESSRENVFLAVQALASPFVQACMVLVLLTVFWPPS